MAYGFHQLGLVFGVGLGLGPTENFGGGYALVFNGRKATRKDCFCNRGSRRSHIKGIDGSPLTGSLLSGGIQHDVNESLPGNRVFLFQDIGGYFNEEGVQFALIPFGENIAHLGGTELKHATQEIV